MCRAETHSIWRPTSLLDIVEGPKPGMGSQREREREREGAEEKGADRNNVFIKKGPSKSSLIVLFAGYARAARDNPAPAR